LVEIIKVLKSGYKLPYFEPYPSSRILKLLAQYKIPVIISDDAHNIERLGDHFNQAEMLVRQTDINLFDLSDYEKRKYTTCKDSQIYERSF